MKTSPQNLLSQSTPSQALRMAPVKRMASRAGGRAPEVALRSLAGLLALIALRGVNQRAFAASQTWKTGATSPFWSVTTDWAGGAAPGATTGNSTDLATFNSALTSGTIGGATNPIVIDTGRVLGSITFDTLKLLAHM